MRCFAFVCVAAACVLASASGVRADTLFSYDFDSLTSNSNLPGQDGWVNWAAELYPSYGFPNARVVNLTDPVNTTNAAGVTNLNGYGYYADRPFATSLTFTSADTAVVFDFLMSSAGGSTTKEGVTAQIWFGANSNMLGVGIANIGSANSMPYVTASGSGEHNGVLSVTKNNWYEVQAVIDFSTAGGVLTSYSLKNLTAGETAFTADTGLANISLGLTATDGVYTATTLGMRFDHNTSGTSAIDNISISNQVPEPGTLALLCCGLAGLLCYAWRTRK